MTSSHTALALALTILAGVLAFALAQTSQRTADTDRYWAWSSIG